MSEGRYGLLFAITIPISMWISWLSGHVFNPWELVMGGFLCGGNLTLWLKRSSR